MLNRRGHSVRRNSIRPVSSFHGLPFFFPLTSQLESALALVSRSTSAYTLVVVSDTCPSQARIVLMSTPERRRCVAVVWRCATDNVDHLGYLLQLTELELLDRERRAADRRLKADRFPTIKTLEDF